MDRAFSQRLRFSRIAWFRAGFVRTVTLAVVESEGFGDH